MTIIAFLAVLSVLVLAHEFGHFFTAKSAGIKVEEFGLGFPPKAYEIKKNETKYTINWIPLGGFVKLKGENGDESEKKDSFASKSFTVKAIVLSAGVLMNVVLAFVLFSIGFMVGLPSSVSSSEQAHVIGNTSIRITQIISGSSAEQAGLQEGDTILYVDGRQFKEIEEVQNYVIEHNNEYISLAIRTNSGQEKNIGIIPQATGDSGGIKILGIGLVKTGLVKYGFFSSIYHGMLATCNVLYRIVSAFYEIIKNLILFNGLSIDIRGPIGVAVMTGQAAKLGFAYLIQFTAYLSLNLAVINILPIPALDGGRLLFAIVEKIRRKANNRKFEEWAHGIGFAMLMLLVIMVTYKDIASGGLELINKIKKIF